MHLALRQPGMEGLRPDGIQAHYLGEQPPQEAVYACALLDPFCVMPGWVGES